MGADRLEVKGTIINFGIDIAYNTRINVTWILDGIDYVHETVELGDMSGEYPRYRYLVLVRLFRTIYYIHLSDRLG